MLLKSFGGMTLERRWKNIFRWCTEAPLSLFVIGEVCEQNLCELWCNSATYSCVRLPLHASVWLLFFLLSLVGFFRKSKEGIIFFGSIVNGGWRGVGLGGASFSAVMLIVWWQCGLALMPPPLGGSQAFDVCNLRDTTQPGHALTSLISEPSF